MSKKIVNKILNFSYTYACSSSSSSSSSHHNNNGHLPPIYRRRHHHPHHQMGSSYWLPTDQQQEDTSRFNNSNKEAEAPTTVMEDREAIEKEHMFDKVVTPSDVGKLNRLVIPKQHAEKYFPLDSSTDVKGLLLNFEDRTGKAWRFRYSYWNSSQSYVMTKGWSRFVKEKKLDAGDIVSFQRGVGESGRDRLYIDWRRRPDVTDHHHLSSIPWATAAVPAMPRDHLYLSNRIAGGYSYNDVSPCSSIVYMRSAAPQEVGMGMVQYWQQGGRVGGGVVEPIAYESMPVVQGKAAAKRLRLFGVNMDCPITESQQQSSAATALQHQQQHHPLQLRLHNGTPLPSPPLASNKGKSSMSLDFHI